MSPPCPPLPSFNLRLHCRDCRRACARKTQHRPSPSRPALVYFVHPGGWCQIVGSLQPAPGAVPPPGPTTVSLPPHAVACGPVSSRLVPTVVTWARLYLPHICHTLILMRRGPTRVDDGLVFLLPSGQDGSRGCCVCGGVVVVCVQLMGEGAWHGSQRGAWRHVERLCAVWRRAGLR